MKPIKHFDLLAHHARRTPDKVALVDLATSERITYREADERACRLANLQREHGLVKGDRVAILARNGPWFFDLQFACGKIGTVTLPLNWRLSASELAYILRDADPGLFIYDSRFAATVDELRSQSAVPDTVEIDPDADRDEYRRRLSEQPVDVKAESLTVQDLVTLMYTSGTSGRPKGALITHQMLLFNNLIATMETGIGANSTFLAVLPLFHIGGLNVYSNPILHAGGTVAILRSFDAEVCLRFLVDPDLGVTHFFAVPTVYEEIAKLAEFEQVDLSAIQSAGVGGAPSPAPLLERWAARGVFLRDSYGMTETAAPILVSTPCDAGVKPASVGKPVLYCETRVVDDNGGDAAVGESGELWLRGPTITAGYWRNPEATAEAYYEGWFRTGDIVRVDPDGDFSIVDRSKDMFISGGENVYPAEVERAVYELPAVAECAVFGVSHSLWGEVGVVYIVSRPGHVLTADQVTDHCRSRLARFKVPYEVVLVDDLPRTASGKILKRQLRDFHPTFQDN